MATRGHSLGGVEIISASRMLSKLHALKTTDAHFAKLAEAYQAVNQKVHLAKSNVAPTEQLAEDRLRKVRTVLKDEIYALLRG